MIWPPEIHVADLPLQIILILEINRDARDIAELTNEIVSLTSLPIIKK